MKSLRQEDELILNFVYVYYYFVIKIRLETVIPSVICID
jgi:hypothetical protein